MDIDLKHTGLPASRGEKRPTIGKACLLLSGILWDLWAWPMLGLTQLISLQPPKLIGSCEDSPWASPQESLVSTWLASPSGQAQL